MSELKPCPFCGGEPWDTTVPGGVRFIGCDPCCVVMETAEAWNRRADHLESEPSGGLREEQIRAINGAFEEYAEGGVRTAEWATLCDKVERALAATPKPPESAEPGSDGVMKELWDFVTKVALGASISSCRAHALKLMEVNILTRPATKEARDA